MFGTTIADYVYGLETATAGAGVSWLKANAPKIFNGGYIPFNAGTLQSVVGLSEKRNTGLNQWDEQLEVGTYSNIDGTKAVDNSRMRCKDKIQCVPNTAYFYSCNTGAYTGNLTILFYDADENYISYYNFNPDHLFTTPDNCHYMTFYTGTAYGTTYKHDICINLSDTAKNGTYEPYTVHTYAFDPTVELRGVPKLKDGKMYFDGDRYLPDGTVTRRFALIDLETLEWLQNPGSTNIYYTYLPNSRNIVDLPVITNAPYTQIPQAQTSYNMSMKVVVGVATVVVYCRNDNVSTVLEFEATINGKDMLYELATPTTETAEPYTANQICDPNGTEEYISDTVAPVGHVTRYLENLRKKVEGLPWNFATLIAPTEATFVATRNYTTGSLFIVNNVLYKATANIANGATITPNSNCTSTTLAEVISALS